MDVLRLLDNFTPESELRTRPRPYQNHSVISFDVVTPQDRAEMLQEIGLNVFFFPSQMITGCDLLSDSGTTEMTNEQWAALHLGDEAYGSNQGYFLLRDQIRDAFGHEFFGDTALHRPNTFLFHQGRACENALFSILGKRGPGQIIPSNGHFDTTQANIEANGISAPNLFSPSLKDSVSPSRFRGNMDVRRLEQLLASSGDRVPLVYLTITNNTGGGQPVSLANIAETSQVCHRQGVPLFLDACRFAENAWFIKNFEQDCENKTIPQIVKETFTHADGFTISFKKDGLVNIGGGLFLRENGLFVEKYPDIPDALLNHQILTEGHPAYGGMSGRDIMALKQGLKTVLMEGYLDCHIGQVREFGETMHALGLPVLTPVGGHAVYLDINNFFADTEMKPEDFGGIALSAVLLGAYGHRTSEVGYFAFGSYDAATGKETFPETNFLRFTIPRLRYEKQDLDAVAEAVKELYNRRDKIPPVNVTHGRDLALRHFKARFEFRQ